MRWLITRAAGEDRTQRYRQWLAAMGVESVTTGAGETMPADVADLDALLLSGGGDVNPARYGQAAHPMTGPADDSRDELELGLVRRFLAVGRPVFGVCRGIQVLSVALGGALIQHVPDRIAGQRFDEQHRLPDAATDARHGLAFVGHSRLRRAMREPTDVNSAHHQAVDADRPGEGLRVTALSPAGIVEAVEGDGLDSPVLAVQWHPERLDPRDPASDRLLGLMVALCTEMRTPETSG